MPGPFDIDRLLRAAGADTTAYTPASARPGDDTRTAMARRAKCERDGHRYQVHGKVTPSRVACPRCGVSWAIGPRTEPSS